MPREYASQDWAHDQDSRTEAALQRLLIDQEDALDTARSIARIYEPNFSTAYTESSLCSLFCSIASEAQLYEDIRAKRLAELIIALHNLPDCRNSNGEVIVADSGVVWRDLPTWAYNFGEWTMRIEELYPPHEAIGYGLTSIFTNPELEGNPSRAQDLLNGSTFGAHVLANLPVGSFDECGGMADAASIALDYALERFHKSEVDPAAPWRLLVLPATAWMIIAGEKLHQLCHNDLPEASTIVYVMSRKWPWKFCLERWVFWKKAFRQLEEPSGIEERHKGATLRAAERMDELDQM